MGHGDDDVLLVDEVRVLDLAEIDGDLRLALGGVFCLDREEIGLDDLQHARFLGEDILEVGNGRVQRFQFFSTSSEVRRCRRISRMAFACLSESSNAAVSFRQASFLSADSLMMRMTSSILASASTSPSKMCARSSALASS